MKSQKRLIKERQQIYDELMRIMGHLYVATACADSPVGRRLQTQKIKTCSMRLVRLHNRINLAGFGRRV